MGLLGIADDSRVDVDAMALRATRSSSGDQAAASAAKVQESPQGFIDVHAHIAPVSFLKEVQKSAK
ncbi:MAG: hypothetical protein IID05_14225, partial [Gemmatimonadetes bacterium]|nr:hypothetical protein [Gemmatimonadota bacterium]